MQTLPPPADRVITLTGDGRDKSKRGKHNPLAQKGRHSEHPPWFFGVRFALLIVRWNVLRLPVASRPMRPNSPPQYQTANALLRDMGRGFTPPAWAQAVLVAGDAAYGSQATMTMVIQRDTADPARTWGGLCAMARPGKTVAGKALID